MENEITINGKIYSVLIIEKDPCLKDKDPCLKDYVIVRTYSAGVFAGNIESRSGQEIILKNARRLWYWDGAASLSQLAMEGVSKPNNCKFPCEVPEITLLNVVEIIPCTEKAQKSIQGVKIWKA